MKLRRRTLLIPALLTLTLAHAQDIRTGDALLRAMHDRYQSVLVPDAHLHPEKHDLQTRRHEHGRNLV